MFCKVLESPLEAWALSKDEEEWDEEEEDWEDEDSDDEEEEEW
jgi:hypothetical protein